MVTFKCDGYVCRNDECKTNQRLYAYGKEYEGGRMWVALLREILKGEFENSRRSRNSDTLGD